MPLKLKQINKETIHTTRYRPGDIRLRYSDKKAELVCKEGDPTKISRKEVIINLNLKENIDKFTEVLKMLNFKSDPPWLKHKQEFEYNLNGYNYNVCLQNIENFAHLLEVEFLSEKDESDLHQKVLAFLFGTHQSSMNFECHQECVTFLRFGCMKNLSKIFLHRELPL